MRQILLFHRMARDHADDSINQIFGVLQIDTSRYWCENPCSRTKNPSARARPRSSVGSAGGLSGKLMCTSFGSPRDRTAARSFSAAWLSLSLLTNMTSVYSFPA